jgi:hypothetical protein
MPPKNSSSPLRSNQSLTKQFAIPPQTKTTITPLNSYNIVTPTTPLLKTTTLSPQNSISKHNQGHYNASSLISNTPVSIKSTQYATYVYSHQQQSVDKTPIKTNQLMCAGGSNNPIVNMNRFQTPSPSSSYKHHMRHYGSSVTPTNTPTNYESSSAPPKPPRRSSVKGN